MLCSFMVSQRYKLIFVEILVTHITPRCPGKIGTKNVLFSKSNDSKLSSTPNETSTYVADNKFGIFYIGQTQPANNTGCIMEMTFYDDTMFRSSRNDGKSLKRPATLDLDSPETARKKQTFAAILTSPDLQMLKLASPELERFIISNGNITTTPTPTSFLFNKNATEEQEQYARGFIDALNHLHQNQFEMSTGGLITRISTGTTPVSNPPVSISTSGNNITKLYPGITPFYLQPATSVIKSLGNPKTTSPSKATFVIRPPSVDSNSNSVSSNSALEVKEELQMVPSDFSSPPLSPLSKGPIDMVDQERIKLERKRYRNRVAASKCRKRKLEKISQLEEKVNELKGENDKLESIVIKLRDQVCFLKQEVLDHAKKGCQIMISKAVAV